jgi:hypothetical protein
VEKGCDGVVRENGEAKEETDGACTRNHKTLRL